MFKIHVPEHFLSFAQNGVQLSTILIVHILFYFLLQSRIVYEKLDLLKGFNNMFYKQKK